ncbi:Hsp70 chaperone [Neocucurbitaria cava]|uniref:Hsp70 chaperone n=1 Tax=Neocucurbitaria cava TaxID=798079 RepID=A0A9W8Y290_9PLEO|nr:Hsp70 chaperone [Neocucurbitaria cava]
MSVTAMAPSECSIGIDLGSANTCTALFRNDKAEIIWHEGQPLMPSFVAFTETTRLVGSAAKRQAINNPENTIFGALKLVGRKLTEPDLKRELKDLPFRTAQADGYPAFVVQYRGTRQIITAVEILAMVLARVKRDLQDYLGGDVSTVNAVITVPSHFNYSQRQAVHDAALIAKLNPVHLMSPAVSACADYTLTQWPQSEMIFAAVFGARTVDVAIGLIEDGAIEIKAVASDTFFGGDDIEARLAHEAICIFTRKTGSIPTSRALRRLRTACKTAKHELASQTQTRIEIDQLCDGHDFAWTITRQNLEYYCWDLIHSCLGPIGQIWKGTNMDRTRIQKAVMTGGSSRIPKIQSLLSSVLGGMGISRCLNPDEAVARGAALYAARFSRSISNIVNSILIMDVVPLTIGVQTKTGSLTTIIKKNTRIPCRYSYELPVLHVGSILSKRGGYLPVIEVFEQGNGLAKPNTYVSKIRLPISNTGRPVREIEVTMEYDEGRKVMLTVTDKRSGEKTYLCLDSLFQIPKKRLEQMKATATSFDLADKAEIQRIEAKSAAEEYAFAILDRMVSKPRTEETMRQNDYASALLKWLDTHPQAPASDYIHQLSEVKRHVEDPLYKGTGEETMQQIYIRETLVDDLRQAGHVDLTWLLDESKDQHLVEGTATSPVNDRYTESGSTISQANAAVESAHGASSFKEPDKRLLGRSYLERLNIIDTVSQVHSNTDSPVKHDHVSIRPNNITSRDTAQSPERDSTPDTHNLDPLLRIASPSISEPAVIGSADEQTAFRSDTPRSTERGIAQLFSTSNEVRPAYTDADFILISTWLNNIGRPSWSMVPRLYTILRLINQLDMLDIFVEQGITDIWFPFTQTSLPHALSPTSKAHFLEHQHVVLSKSLLFE